MSQTSLPVTDWVYEWRENPDKKYTEHALENLFDAMRNDYMTGRRSSGVGRFRPSMIGDTCPRAQVLSYLGFEQAEGNPEWEQMAHVGTWLHYGWQLEGVAAGWLIDTEVQIEIPEWHLTGSMDGICKDDSIFELKTVGSEKFHGRRHGVLPVAKWESPKREHERQVLAYMHATGCRAASIVYADRDSNKFREFRVLWDQDKFDELNEYVLGMVGAVHDGVLPPILPGCQEIFDLPAYSDRPKGPAARKLGMCNYREVCKNAQFRGLP